MNHAVPVGGMMFIGHEELSTWGRLRDVLPTSAAPRCGSRARRYFDCDPARARRRGRGTQPLDWGYRATTELGSGHDSCAPELNCQALNQHSAPANNP